MHDVLLLPLLLQGWHERSTSRQCCKKTLNGCVMYGFLVELRGVSLWHLGTICERSNLKSVLQIVGRQTCIATNYTAIYTALMFIVALPSELQHWLLRSTPKEQNRKNKTKKEHAATQSPPFCEYFHLEISVYSTRCLYSVLMIMSSCLLFWNLRWCSLL